MLYQSENHLNYYRFNYGTTSPNRVLAAMRVERKRNRRLLRSRSASLPESGTSSSISSSSRTRQGSASTSSYGRPSLTKTTSLELIKKTNCSDSPKKNRYITTNQTSEKKKQVLHIQENYDYDKLEKAIARYNNTETKGPDQNRYGPTHYDEPKFEIFHQQPLEKRFEVPHDGQPSYESRRRKLPQPGQYRFDKERHENTNNTISSENDSASKYQQSSTQQQLQHIKIENYNQSSSKLNNQRFKQPEQNCARGENPYHLAENPEDRQLKLEYGGEPRTTTPQVKQPQLEVVRQLKDDQNKQPQRTHPEQELTCQNKSTKTTQHTKDLRETDQAGRRKPQNQVSVERRSKVIESKRKPKTSNFWVRDINHQRQLDSPLDLKEPEPSADELADYNRGLERSHRYPEDQEFYGYPSARSPSRTGDRYVERSLSPEHAQYSNSQHSRRPQQYSHNLSPGAQQLNDSHQHKPRRPMGKMGSLEDHERKVIIEFCHLLEKSKQLFNGLRELPQYGHKQWHSYFGRTFDVYTKLWKFQQQHRSVLDSKYGLKRWQIGEIASKIGQLYYHFYLRTSETAYLNEAFSFYYAIRGRSYYTKACKEDKCELIVKKLRYYARFIVVCLLLKKIKLVRELIKELDRQILEYGSTYDPDDQMEWNVVVDEVKAFIQAEPVVSVIHPENYPVILSHRLSPLTTPPVERLPQMSLTLQEVLIVGSSSQQVKFSELTMDMFRMLQTLEREPTGEIQHMYDDSPRQRFNLTPSALNNKGYNLETTAPRCENPHKYLLFKPSPSQILVYLASGCNDLPPNGALLLYISADGQIVQPSKHPEDGYDIGGLITTSKNDLYRECSKDQKGNQSKHKELQCFHPGDLYPFTRRPLFVIIDSDNSYVFQNIPRHFGQPLVILMSPLEVPSSLHVTSDRRQQGSLFTLFLHSPLTAFCHCCDIHTIPLVHWDRAQAYIDAFLAEASQIVTRSRIDSMFLIFMGDDFLRLLTLRFIFCEMVLRMHRAFRTRTQLTRSSPSIPDDLLEHPALTHIIMDLANHLQVRGNFHDPSAAGPLPTKE